MFLGHSLQHLPSALRGCVDPNGFGLWFQINYMRLRCYNYERMVQPMGLICLEENRSEMRRGWQIPLYMWFLQMSSHYRPLTNCVCVISYLGGNGF